MKFYLIAWNIISEFNIKEMMPLVINKKMRKIVTMMNKEERKRIKKIPNRNPSPNRKERIKRMQKMQNLKKSQNANSNDMHMSINTINLFID